MDHMEKHGKSVWGQICTEKTWQINVRKYRSGNYKNGQSRESGNIGYTRLKSLGNKTLENGHISRCSKTKTSLFTGYILIQNKREGSRLVFTILYILKPQCYFRHNRMNS